MYLTTENSEKINFVTIPTKNTTSYLTYTYIVYNEEKKRKKIIAQLMLSIVHNVSTEQENLNLD